MRRESLWLVFYDSAFFSDCCLKEVHPCSRLFRSPDREPVSLLLNGLVKSSGFDFLDSSGKKDS